MPAEIQTGTGIVYGVTNSGSAITMTGFATFILETAKGGHKFDLADIKDENNADVTLIATNARIELDIAWTPSGATRAAAATTAAFITPLTKVTLANFKVTAFNGDYVYVGDESIDLSHGAAKMSMKLRRYTDTNQNASLVATVTG